MTTAVRFQALPPLSPDEYLALEQSIVENGVMVAVIVDEAGIVIDGHHRQKIAAEHGIFCPTRAVPNLDDTKKRTLALSLNLDRRHLTREQRRALVAESVRSDPHLSDREHARRTGVSDKTAGSVRRDLESTAEIPQSDTRVSADGRERPSSQPPRPDPELPPDPYENFADETPSRPISLPARPVPKPSQQEMAPRRRPLTDTAREIGLDLKNLTGRMERFLADDRFARNRSEVAPHLRFHLAQAIKVCQDLEQHINQGEV